MKRGIGKKFVFGLATLSVLVVAFYLVGSVTRSISTVQDNEESFIRNSNGKYWEATGSNIQTAINDAASGGAHGVVWLPGGNTLTVTSTVLMAQDVTLDLGGSKIVPSGNFNVIELRSGSLLRDGTIDVSSVASFASAAITFSASDSITESASIPRVHNVELVSASNRGKGVYLRGTGSQAIMTEFNDVTLRNFDLGIHLHSDSASAKVSSNSFSNIVGYGNKKFVRVEEASGEARGNYFQGLQCFCSASTQSIIWNKGQANTYDTVIAYDWPGAGASYDFSSGGHQCYLSFRGGAANINMGTWNANTNAYTVMDMENNRLTLGWVNTKG